jgi:hypothetical protein
MTDIEHGNDIASDADKVGGIVEQMRGDISQGNVSEVKDALQQRLADSGITVSAIELEELLARLG